MTSVGAASDRCDPGTPDRCAIPPALDRQFVKDELRHRARLAALGRPDRVTHPELDRVLGLET